MTKSILQPGVEIQTLYSENLNQELLLFIKLPFEYNNENESYPILYSLDGNYSFPFFSTSSLYYEMPMLDIKNNTIIVGIGYVVSDDRIKGLAEFFAWRSRDLTPIANNEIDRSWQDILKTYKHDIEVHTGGADLFLKSLCEEVLPFIETNYRARSEERGLAGYSLGGTFTLYALFQKSHYFQNYFVGSPWIWQVLFEEEERFAESHQDLKARVFMSLGSEENDYLESFNKMKELLESRAYPGLDLNTQIFKDEDHNSCNAAAINRALRWLYYSN